MPSNRLTSRDAKFLARHRALGRQDEPTKRERSGDSGNRDMVEIGCVVQLVHKNANRITAYSIYDGKIATTLPAQFCAPAAGETIEINDKSIMVMAWIAKDRGLI